ncbi:MAG TPA: hypothetical protein VGK73_27540 [Polyangiaceae bacterium]
MTQRLEIGEARFSRAAMRAAIPEFLELHARRPIAHNEGGMRAPHLFAAWFMVKNLRPTHIVESGVFKGQGTWLLEHAAPEAELFCIDPNPSTITYRSPRATYSTADFGTRDWNLPRETTLLFFDDHQNALERVRQAHALGFSELIFEDNYPIGQGDCYSLKKALMGEEPAEQGIGGIWRRFSGKREPAAAYLERMLAAYLEFPPVVKASVTRWGDAWSDERYPTPAPLFERAEDVDSIFAREATAYTWMCYARLRPEASGSAG